MQQKRKRLKQAAMIGVPAALLIGLAVVVVRTDATPMRQVVEEPLDAAAFLKK